MRTVTLRDITLNITDGKHGDCEAAENSGFYFVSCKDVNNGTIDYDNARQISEKAFGEAHKRTQLEPNDILITNSGTIGRMALVKDIPETYRTTFQKSVAIVKPDTSVVLPTYLYYKLQNCVTEFVNRSNGSAQKNLLLGTMRDFQIELHEDFAVQEHLSAVLSAYDDLIENNRRQIKLLEEAVQRLYKEWFVDLKFPGHESTPTINGLPEGWIKGELDDLVDECGTRIKKHERNSFEHYLPIDFLPSKSFTCWSSKPVSEAESSLLAFEEGNFVFGAMRPYFHKVIVAPYAGITRSTCFVLCAKNKLSNYFAYMSLFYEQTIRYATSISVGTTMPYVRWNDLRRMKLVIPHQDLQRAYTTAVCPIFCEVTAMERQIAAAREARDRLLPKLMSGEIEV